MIVANLFAIELTEECFENLGMSFASVQRIAALFGVPDTVAMRYLDPTSVTGKAYNAGRAKVETLIIDCQIKTAMEGNAQMLTWLGKQYLGQAEYKGQKRGIKALESPDERATGGTARIDFSGVTTIQTTNSTTSGEDDA
jgi:hypothetical protein